MNRQPGKESNQTTFQTPSQKSITKTSDTISVEKKSAKKNSILNWYHTQKSIADKKIILSQAYNNSFRFIGFDTWTDDVFELIKSGNCIYEDYLVCKPYIDYEYKVDFKSYTLNKKEHNKIALERMGSIVRYMKSAMHILTNDHITDFDIKVTSSHGQINNTSDDSDPEYYKYSYHFLVNSKFRFQNSCDAKQLINIINSNHEFDKDITKFIDKNVYKVNKKSYQKMRCIFSYKNENDRRFLEPIDCNTGKPLSSDNILITDYIISYYENDIVFLKETNVNSIPKNKQNGANKNDTIVTPIVKSIFDSDEEKELLIMLRKIVKSAYFISNKTDESNVTYYTYDYSHSEKCIHGKKHDRINGYVCRNGFNVYGGCFSEGCKNLKTKKIGTLNMFNENWNVLHNVTHFNTNYIPEDTVMEQINKFMVSTSKDDKILGIKSNMNTGKTQSVGSMLNSYFDKYDSNRRVLTFSTRQAYSNDVVNNGYKDLVFSNYLDIKDKTKLVEKNRLIISLESLYKLYISSEDLKIYDVIILDECESLLTHFFSSTVKSNRSVFDNFVDLLKCAKKIVCLDADMSIARSIKFLESITNKVTIFKNDYKQIRRKFKCINNFDKYYEKIKYDIREGKNVCIVSVNKDNGLQLRDLLQKDFPDISDKIKFVYGQCDKTLKDQLEDVNTNWTKYRVLIYNTVISQGVNFDVKDHFNSIFVYITGHLCSAKEIMQMIGRIRYPVQIDIWCLIDNKVSKKTDNFVYSIDYAHKYCHTMLTDIPTDTLKMYYKDENKNTCVHSETVQSTWNMLRASYVQEHLLNNSNSNIMTVLKMLIDSNGDIYEEEYDIEIPKVNSKSYSERVVETKTLTIDENTKLSKKNPSELTENDILTMAKYQHKHKQQLSDMTPEEIVNECITLYIKNKKVIDIIIRVNKNKHNNDTDSEQVQDEDTEDELTIEIQKYFKSAYDKTVTALDYKHTDKTKTFETEDFDERFKNVEYTNAEILSLNSKGRLKDKYQIAKTVLARCGILLRNQTKRVYKNKKQIRVDFYVLSRDQEIYEIVHNIVADDNNSYNKDFTNMIKSYNKYQEYISQPTMKEKSRQIVLKKSLFSTK